MILMSCCSTPNASDGTNRFFTRMSKVYAKQFRKKGLAKEQRMLLDGVKRMPIHGTSILDIGCGVGSLHLTLLNDGAGKAVGVDMAIGMIKKAGEFARELGVHERATYIHGDFVQSSAEIPEADITLLDKVVCCYDDLPRLLEESTTKTRKVYALTHPKENVVLRMMFKGHIALAKLFRWKFRPSWHNWAFMRRYITMRGFSLVYENATLAWQVLVFVKPARA